METLKKFFVGCLSSTRGSSPISSNTVPPPSPARELQAWKPCLQVGSTMSQAPLSCTALSPPAPSSLLLSTSLTSVVRTEVDESPHLSLQLCQHLLHLSFYCQPSEKITAWVLCYNRGNSPDLHHWPRKFPTRQALGPPCSMKTGTTVLWCAGPKSLWCFLCSLPTCNH